MLGTATQWQCFPKLNQGLWTHVFTFPSNHCQKWRVLVYLTAYWVSFYSLYRKRKAPILLLLSGLLFVASTSFDVGNIICVFGSFGPLYLRHACFIVVSMSMMTGAKTLLDHNARWFDQSNYRTVPRLGVQYKLYRLWRRGGAESARTVHVYAWVCIVAIDYSDVTVTL